VYQILHLVLLGLVYLFNIFYLYYLLIISMHESNLIYLNLTDFYLVILISYFYFYLDLKF